MEKNNFLEKKKEVLDKIFKEYPNSEILNLGSSKRQEPLEGFPILEVSERTPDGDKKWLSFKEGVEKYGYENITLRRILPDEISLDCDDCNVEEILELINESGGKYEWWSTTPEKPYEHVHIRFRISNLNEYSPNERWLIKEFIIKSIHDKMYRTPDPCCAQPCRMISVEWSRHHKRNEYLQLIKKKEGKEWILPKVLIYQILEEGKEALEKKKFNKDGSIAGIRAKWLCPSKNEIIQEGRKETGRHRGKIVVAAHCNNLGKTREDALEFLRKWNEKNEPPAEDETLVDQVNFVYDNGITHITCEWLKRQGFCKKTKCEFENMNKNAFKEIIKLPEKYEKEVVTGLYEEKYEDITKLRLNCFELILKKKQEEMTELIVEYISEKTHIYTTKNDLKEEVWIYDGGIYVPNGISCIKEIIRTILQELYTSHIANKIIVKIQADTYIDEDDFFRTNYKEEIPVLNGILNVVTLELNKFNPNRIFFSKIPVKYDPDAKCPNINKFLESVLKDKEDIIVMEEVAGYGLYKENFLEKAFMFNGKGRNGKGKTIILLKKLYGERNVCAITLSRLHEESFSLSEMFGKLANLAGDFTTNVIKDTGVIKTIVGRDLIGAKRKFLRDIFFIPYAKQIFACNDLPRVYDMSLGFWSKWLLFDFPYTFVDNQEYEKIQANKNFSSQEKNSYKIKDPYIIDKIITDEEMSGFLNKSLEGLKRLLENNKFSTTKGTEEIKKTWIRKSNSCSAFCIDEVKEKEGNVISKSEFRRRYNKYCKKHNVKSISDKSISITLQETFGVVSLFPKSANNFTDEYAWEGIEWK